MGEVGGQSKTTPCDARRDTGSAVLTRIESAVHLPVLQEGMLRCNPATQGLFDPFIVSH